MFELGLYEKAMPNDLSINEKIQLTKKCGFDFMEISVDETDNKLGRLKMQKTTRKEIVACQIDENTRIGSMCLSGHRKYPFGSMDKNIRNKSMDIMKAAIDLASDLSCRIIQLAGYDVYYETSDERTREYFLDNLRVATALAAQNGVLLGFETMETEFMDTVSKAMRYVEEINSPYLQVYPDIGNLNNAANKYHTSIKDDILQGSGHIIAAHLKETVENKYRDLFYGEGQVDFISVVKLLKSLGVNRFVGEFWDNGSEKFEERITCANAFLRAVIKES
ncbi:MAG: L-ribulose-5-phosphate 3-epimerase [Clostridia bacterium]